MARVQSVDDKAVFVFVNEPMLITLGGWSLSYPTDRHGRDPLGFCNLSGCEQLVHVPLILLVIDSIC